METSEGRPHQGLTKTQIYIDTQHQASTIYESHPQIVLTCHVCESDINATKQSNSNFTKSKNIL